jgi:hypothetical protein
LSEKGLILLNVFFFLAGEALPHAALRVSRHARLICQRRRHRNQPAATMPSAEMAAAPPMKIVEVKKVLGGSAGEAWGVPVGTLVGGDS